MTEVTITEFTDPGCPWAYSAEPFRRRIDWLYGERLSWRPRMVVLARATEDYLERGFTTERQAASLAAISRDHGMPIDTAERPRVAATLGACATVVAAGLFAPERQRHVLRRLRVRNFSGELLDEPATLDAAAADAGLDPAEVREWSRSAEVEQALEADVAAARAPMRAARILDHKLANWSGGRRYTCPSYEIERNADGVRITVPGFQPFAAYDVVLANLLPDLERRDPARSVAEVLEWAGTPLATKEVAVVCDIDFARAREELGRVAIERHVGSDGFWTLG